MEVSQSLGWIPDLNLSLMAVKTLNLRLLGTDDMEVSQRLGRILALNLALKAVKTLNFQPVSPSRPLKILLHPLLPIYGQENTYASSSAKADIDKHINK